MSVQEIQAQQGVVEQFNVLDWVLVGASRSMSEWTCPYPYVPEEKLHVSIIKYIPPRSKLCFRLAKRNALTVGLRLDP